VLWDGQMLFTKQSNRFEKRETYRHTPAEGVELIRIRGNLFLPPLSELKKVWTLAKEFAGLPYKDSLNSWYDDKDVFAFKLPGNVEIFMTNSNVRNNFAADVLIKMQPLGVQGGYCGNFNGKRDDDKQASGRGPVEEDWFGMSLMESATETVTEEVADYSAAPAPCDEGTPAHKMAESACAHIKVKEIRDACITDSCDPRQQGENRSRIDAAMDAAVTF